MKIEQPWNDERLKIGSTYIGCVTKENADLIMDLQRDAERMRWILQGNGYFMEESSLCGPWVEPDDVDEQDRARCHIDKAMRSNVKFGVAVLRRLTFKEQGMALTWEECGGYVPAERKIARELAEKMVDDRAHRIASMAAEELIRCEGEATSGIDEFAVPQCQVDDHMRDCIAHLCWHGEAVSYETEDGYIVVQLGDFTIGGGA